MSLVSQNAIPSFYEKLSFSETMCIVCEEYEFEGTNCDLKEVELEKSA